MNAPISHAAAAAKNRRNALPLTSLDAARHLRRMSLGPKATEIVGLTGSSVSQYVASQLSMVVSRSTFETALSRGELGRPNLFDNNSNSGLMAQMVKLLSAPDTLRNRIAFALSEMFVVSRTGNDWSVTHFGDAIAAYNDILCIGATGTFRVMIESIARSPAMALYLTHFCNQKASNGREPYQNFAREIMQLFCIGLYELNLDGTRVKAGELQPSDPRYIANGTQDVPTYTNIDIVNVARVFTGLCLPNPQGQPAFSIQNPALFDDQTLVQNGWASRLVFDPLYHESTLPKVALQGRINIPVGVGGDISLATCLDALVAHPSTAPFIAGRMIRLLMTSNPTSAYVARVEIGRAHV